MGTGWALVLASLSLHGCKGARPHANRSALLLTAMRIDPKASIRGVPVLELRKLLRALNSRLSWDLGTIKTVLSATPRKAEHMLSALEAADLARPRRGKGSKTWTTTARAQAFASATAARAITRQTAKRALAEFLGRVGRVNSDKRFLAKVTRVILFGSYLRGDVDRLSDVDIAIQLEPKEKDRRILRQLNDPDCAGELGWLGSAAYEALRVKLISHMEHCLSLLPHAFCLPIVHHGRRE